MSTLKLIGAALKSRDAYTGITSVVDIKNCDEHTQVLFKEIGEYYDKDSEASYCDVEILKSTIERVHKRFSKNLNKTVDEAVSLDVSEANLINDIISTKKDATHSDLISLLAANSDFGEITRLYEQLKDLESGLLNIRDLTVNASEMYSFDQFGELTKNLQEQTKIPFVPESLNTRLEGGVPPKSHVVVFGRPDSGKTTFITSNINNWLRNNLKILYYGNEDAMEQILIRLLQGYFNRPKDSVMANMSKAIEKSQEAYNNLYLVETSSGSLGDLEKRIKDVRPDVWVVDQIRNLGDHASAGRVLQLEMVAAAQRELAKKYGGLAVSVTQAGDTAEGKLHLGMSDMDFNKTGIQSTADLIIGIGVTDSSFNEGIRGLSTPKNKVSGNRDLTTFNMDVNTARVS